MGSSPTRCTLVAVLGALLALSSGAVEWRNVDAQSYLGGRKASAGYLQGKVVLVHRWGANDASSRALLPRIETIWKSFKTKSFVALGGHCKGCGGAKEAGALVKANKLTYPNYDDAGLAVGEPKFSAASLLYVVDESGKVVYLGRDDRTAMQAVVQALTDLEAPRDLAQWKRFLDYELEHLPCHGYLRLREFRTKFPNEARAYVPQAKALLAISDLKKVAELVEFARKAKDPPTFGPRRTSARKQYQKLVADVISKCGALKDHPDPRVAQEAKNALADLRWTQATF